LQIDARLSPVSFLRNSNIRPFLSEGLRFFSYATLGIVLTLLGAYITYLERRPDLEAWHLAALDAEYSLARGSLPENLDDYLQLETALFEQLDAEVYAGISNQEQRRYLRYSDHSLADPRGREPDWNRTLWRPHPDARGAVLLLHGLSDSPYSMRSLAQLCYDQGYSVLVLRMPGHGTAPSGLLRVTFEDWMAAVRLGMRHLRRQVPDNAPLYVAGYSTGAALAVEYAAARLLGEDIPAATGLILLSPAIGVSDAAALAIWQARLSALPGLTKVAWTDIQPEYDPYKYNSFTVNAGDQVYRLTQLIAAELDQLATPNGVQGMPPILAFESVADATVSAPAVLHALFMRLAPEGHELVGFDINQNADLAPLFEKPVNDVRETLLAGPVLPVNLTLVTNASDTTDAVVVVKRGANSTAIHTESLNMHWPPGVYSLSHVALPFPPDDPVYGASRPPGNASIFLGNVDLQGERGLLAVPAEGFMRLRHNPFFPYIAARVGDFLNGDSSGVARFHPTRLEPTIALPSE